MRTPPTRVAAALAVVAVLALVAVAAGAPPLFADESPDGADRADDPTTAGTVGYVEGYWYDDELPVDEGDDAVVEDDELEAVVYRSMARVEKIRGLTFEDDVPVEVISREEFRSQDSAFVDSNESQQRVRNVTYEALFMVDAETNATTELQSIYGGSVEGYYEPSTDRIVIVSNTPDRLELDEIVLGHELTHALQDQQFDLSNYERATIDQEAAENGLIEGDAVSVETEYERRCGTDWECLPDDDSDGEAPSNWGLYLTLYQPYSDGPAYVDHVRESGDGWSAVNDRYEDPPTSSSTVIHREDRDPVDVSVADRSNESWQPLEVGGEVATETVGEGAMVAMFANGAFEPGQSSVLSREAVLGDDPTTFDYNQSYTDGWAGDELVTYASADADGNASADTGYVWETEWRSADHAREFAGAYVELLENHGADPVEDRQDTYAIDDEGYPGAYFLERDGETVRIVHAPSVAALDGLSAGAAPTGEDTIERVDGTDSAEEEDEDTAEADDSLPGFAVPGTGAAVAIALLAARARARRLGAEREAGSDSSPRTAPVTDASPPSTPAEPDAGLEWADGGRSARGRA
ncbi:hypothetical protein Htur_0400 [Haloterrigena turkmenica DSM 5511]|uniref:PGF-CTERM sorting domain-containing protein n=1 Tax=Haloterrigena turkmenica (strain ATCC 51198 / DSM 5511 / JCM 9101 / NCIMB 13204 / VKM B-1734 / 4k) TaxID=543526 RepID=D2RV07_HALTV|nr:Hvo_1808 family surface protein [Haloterrigena turkmenica]ADB59300.1 hypothetical protein Htur_0400 [Haloterrigena turkmenica DSM 5511]